MEGEPLVELLAAVAASEPVTWVLLYLIFREVAKGNQDARARGRSAPARKQGEG